MKQNDFYEVDGCTFFVPVTINETFADSVGVTVDNYMQGYRLVVKEVYRFPKANEPQKPVVPKFVADFYESIKDDFESKVYDLCLQFNRDNGELSSELYGWFDCGKNEPIQTLVKMKLYGYEVEQEKLYTVEIPNPNSKEAWDYYLKMDSLTGKLVLFKYSANPHSYKDLWLTEAEIKQDFEWAWDAGFAKEVK